MSNVSYSLTVSGKMYLEYSPMSWCCRVGLAENTVSAVREVASSYHLPIKPHLIKTTPVNHTQRKQL